MADNEKALDSWVQGALSDVYGHVPDERLPDEWIKMVEGGSGRPLAS